MLKSMLIDLFRGSPDPEVSLTNVERMFVCCAHPDGKVTIRHYCVKLKKSGTKACVLLHRLTATSAHLVAQTNTETFRRMACKAI